MVINDALTTDFPARDRVVVMGAFDGLHIGHQYLIRRTCAEATERGIEGTVLTFEPVPQEAFAPPGSPGMRLTTADERCDLLRRLCVDRAVIAPFDTDLQAMTAEQFARDILAQRLQTRVLVAAENHHFGHGQGAGIEKIRSLGETYGFELIVLPLLKQDGTRVSSTAIRQYLWDAHAEEAAALLGRNYSLRGTVVTGKGVGRSLGFPTANVAPPPNKLVPGPAVYSALASGRALVDQLGSGAVPCPAAVNVGPQPTFGRSNSTVEAHLLTDQPLELVGETIELSFMRRLRPVEKFVSIDDLKVQIRRDVERVAAQMGLRSASVGSTCEGPEPAQ